MQYNEWASSAHATSLETMLGSESAADACLACHSGDYTFAVGLLEDYDEGNREGDEPQMPSLEQAQYGVTCITCHDPHYDDEPLPDLLRSESYNLCVSCHTASDLLPGGHHPVRQMFEGISPFAGDTLRPSPHFQAEDGPDCVTCHMQSLEVFYKYFRLPL